MVCVCVVQYITSGKRPQDEESKTAETVEEEQGEFTRGLVLCEIFYHVKQAIFWRLCRVGAAVCGTDLAVR